MKRSSFNERNIVVSEKCDKNLLNILCFSIDVVDGIHRTLRYVSVFLFGKWKVGLFLSFPEFWGDIIPFYKKKKKKKELKLKINHFKKKRNSFYK